MAAGLGVDDVDIDMTTTASVLLCWYLFSGFFLAVVCDVIFIKDGFNRLCFSPKEFALIAVAWPYYVFNALWGQD